MKKNYIVCIDWEIYRSKGNNSFYYSHLDQYEKPVYFENIKEAEKFVDNYPLQIDKEISTLYSTYLSLYEYDEKLVDISETEGIDPNGNGELYSKCYSYEEIEEKAGVKIEDEFDSL